VSQSLCEQVRRDARQAALDLAEAQCTPDQQLTHDQESPPIADDV